MGSDTAVTFILPFRPSVLIGPKPYNNRKKLNRWLKILGLPESNRGGTVIRSRLLEATAALHTAGIQLYFQPECLPGMKTKDLAPPSLISEIEIASVLKQANLVPSFHLNRDCVREAYEQRVVLDGFRLSEFLESFDKKPPPIKGGGPYQGREKIRFRREDGPRLLVDEDGVILFLYLPGYLTDENQSEIDEALEAFCAEVRPTPDAGCQDRRANQEANTDPAKEVDELWDGWCRAASQHHCLAWIARGQAGHMDPVTSRQLRAAFQKKSPDAVPALLRYYIWKSMLDQRINDLVRRLHPAFYDLLLELRQRLSDSDIPPPVLWDVWSSIFAFQAVGFNRQTRMHRDSAGMEGGLDLLFLLGDFEGGDLEVQDLGLEVDWLPGDLCAFDGKIFSHGIKSWRGQKRRCFIYFVHRNVLKHFGLPTTLPFPLVSELLENNFGPSSLSD
ncbi:hypothetical protein FS749_009627 [Ceratobasidium sp. UAMH 11750]|nr:hypothetical protein FS749_009627 [Ceratobasidium sp. UAMH 11750]